MESTLRTRRRELEAQRSSALIITLVVLLLVTLLVVSLTGMVGLERTTSRNGFENERAKQLGNLAVDEVLATLRDNIPTNYLWAVGPGQLETTNSTGAFTTIQLNTGSSNAVTGGVDLNAQVLGGSSSASYPIIPTNSEYGTSETPMVVGWNLVLQDGTIIRSGGSTSAITSTNPVVGRYAYWVDVETGKVNINTAGKGQATYTLPTAVVAQGVGNYAAADSQNLTASPSRVDLSQLDGSITPQQSIAAYHYTYGGYYAGDYITNYLKAPSSYTGVATTSLPLQPSNPTLSSTPVYTVPEGLLHFNSIYDLQLIPNDSFTPSDLTSGYTTFTQTQVEQNKFYLTTKSRTPEVTPWGYNRLWMQIEGLQGNSGYNVGWGGLGGNRANGRGIPAAPYYATTNYYPGGSEGSHNWSSNPEVLDTRYYYYPFNGNAASTSSATVTNYAYDLQWLNSYGAVGSAPFVTNMMVLMNRTDWPGMPTGASFVSKYGTNECVDLAYGLFSLFQEEFGIGSGPAVPAGDAGSGAWDPYSPYGHAVGITPYNGRLAMPELPEAPLINEIAVTFQGTTAGYMVDQSFNYHADWANAVSANVTNATPQIYTNGTVYTDAGKLMWSTNTTSYAYNYTKDGTRPGFAPPITNFPLTTPLIQATNGAAYMNVAMTPAIQLYYPAGYKDTYIPTATAGAGTGAVNGGAKGAVGIEDILVTASGQYTPMGTDPTTHAAYTTRTVTYGSNSLANGWATGSNGDSLQYYWGFPDDHPQDTLPSGQQSGVVCGYLCTTTIPIMTSGTSVIAQFNPIYIGPFDNNTSPQITIQFRSFVLGTGFNTANDPYEMVPMGFNYGTGYKNALNPSGSYGGASPAISTSHGGNRVMPAWTNVVTSLFPGAPVTNPTTNNAPTLLFGTTNQVFTANDASPSRAMRWVVSDPRVTRYVADWTENDSTVAPSATSYCPTANYGISNGTNFNSYVHNNYATNGVPNSAIDTVTGIRGDDSKLVFPQIGMLSYHWGNGGGGVDPRTWQFANNITTFPGIGWLSMMPLNIESSQGTVATGLGSGVTAGVPVPWRTLSLSPSTSTTQLPDWLLMDIFTMAYESTYLSQTDGKVNVNCNITPFSTSTSPLYRLKPMQALMTPANFQPYYSATANYMATTDFPAFTTTPIGQVATNIALGPSGSDYVTGPTGSLPSNIFMYQGQICQLNSLGGDAYVSGTGITNQWQAEAVARNIIGTITTKSSDFKVYVVAQTVKELPGTYSSFNPVTSVVVTGEQRMSALISRETNVNGQTSGAAAQYNMIPADIPDPNNDATGAVTDGVVNMASRPPFRYVISDITYNNN